MRTQEQADAFVRSIPGFRPDLTWGVPVTLQGTKGKLKGYALTNTVKEFHKAFDIDLKCNCTSKVVLKATPSNVSLILEYCKNSPRNNGLVGVIAVSHGWTIGHQQKLMTLRRTVEEVSTLA